VKNAIFLIGKACGVECFALFLLDVVDASLVATPLRCVAWILALAELRREDSPFT